jgi:hypothetical protein
MTRRWLIVAVLIATGVGVWWARRKPANYPEAYVADRSATLWSATAQVRRQVGKLGYGERVSVMGRAGELTEVRAADGTQGWIDNRLLMAPALWKQVGQLLADARSMPVQAKGHTRTLSNVRIDPGRDSARIFQFGHNVSVAVLERQVAAMPASDKDEDKSGDEGAAGGGEKPGKSDMEDWLLVLYQPANMSSGVSSGSSSGAGGGVGAGADSGPAVPIAGWVISRFIELDPPTPIGDYTSAAARRVVGWEQLNTVSDASGAKPQYVVAAAKGGEGQPCDFTSIRVYTWGTQRKQYETSYVENNLCGRLPLRVTQGLDGPEFRFNDAKNTEHAYRLMQTVVRRIPAPGSPGNSKGRATAIPRAESRAGFEQ